MICGHVVNWHGFDLSQLYTGDYVNKTYSDRLTATFDRIMALPAEQSDNRQRVAWINEFARTRAFGGRRLLDVGSGLAVFPAAMKEAGWQSIALDPDPLAAQHARDHACVEAWCGDFATLEPSTKFDLVTFNKVLEHVQDTVGLLERAKTHLALGGVVYVELPDGESALEDTDGPEREEFFVEHYCAFSVASLALLARHAGYCTDAVERVREASGKYTLRAMLSPTDGGL